MGRTMTLDEAVMAVEATLDSSQPRVDRRLVREDADSLLLLVLDTSNGRYTGHGTISNGPRLSISARARSAGRRFPRPSNGQSEWQCSS